MAELFVPAQTLNLGTYLVRLHVAMAVAPQLTATASVYVLITPSGITPNLMRFGTSTVTHGSGQDLYLDPGIYSDDPDALSFNTSVSLPRNIQKVVSSIVAVELELRVLLPYPWSIELPHSERQSAHHR